MEIGKESHTGWKSWAVLSTVVVVFLALLLPTGADATGSPRVSLSLPHNASAGAKIPFSWSARHLFGGNRLVIQKPVGTAHSWKTVLKLPSDNGSAELAGLPLGKYRYRIAVLSGRSVLAKQSARVAVFGEVPLSTLFGSQNLNESATFPGFTFPYVTYKNEMSPNTTMFQVEHNECSFVHIAFVPSATTNGGSLVLVQETREPVTASAPNNAIGSLDAQLTPGQSWAINSGGYENIHLNGYAICDSQSPIF